MSTNHLETIKQVAQHLETVIEKIDSLVFWPITWDDSYELLRELKTAVEQIDNLNEQLESIFDDDSFWNNPQNKNFVENIEEASNCFTDFSWHFSRIDSVLEEETSTSLTLKPSLSQSAQSSVAWTLSFLPI